MQALVDEFDAWYNTQRRHQQLVYRADQGRQHRMTPQQAWQATPVVDPPEPLRLIEAIIADQPGQFDGPRWQDNLTQSMQPGAATVKRSGNGSPVKAVPVHRTEEAGYGVRSVNGRGYVSFRGVRFQMGHRYYECEVRIAWDPEFIVFADMDGVLIVVHEHPPSGTTYVSNSVRQGRPRKTGKSQDNGEASPMS